MCISKLKSWGWLTFSFLSKCTHFLCAASLFPPGARHNRKSSRIVLLNQWLHCAGSCSFQEQFSSWSITLCSQASVPHQLRQISAQSTPGAAGAKFSELSEQRNSPLILSSEKKKAQTLTGFYSDISQCL